MDPAQMTLAQYMGMAGVLYNSRDEGDERSKIEFIADGIQSEWIPAQTAAVFVVQPDYEYEGLGTPEGAFLTREAAEKYVEFISHPKNPKGWGFYEITEIEVKE